MNANELRIGNLLFHNNEIITVKGISPHCGDYAINCEKKYINKRIELDETETITEEIRPTWVYLRKCKPVQLTEEWLSKFGFEYEDLGDDTPYEWYKKDNIEIWDFNGEYWICDMLDQYVFEKEIKYVHQLQNLYFALTNTELEVK